MTITKGFGFTLDTQTGNVERWAAVDTASAQSHIDAARERMKSAGVPTLAECAVKAAPLKPARQADTAPGSPEEFAVSEDPRCKDGGNACIDCLMQGQCMMATPAPKPCRCGPDGCSDSGCAGRVANEAR